MSAHSELAQQALDRGNARRALEHLEHDSDFTAPETWALRAEALIMDNRADEAEDAARRGLAIAPTDDRLLLALASTFEHQGRVAEAEQALLRVLNANPDHREATYSYAWLLVKAGDTVGARSMLQRVPPGNGSGTVQYFALSGYIAMVEGRRKDAQAMFEVARAMAPESSGIRSLMALQAGLEGRSNEFAGHGLAAAQLDPAAAGELGREARYSRHPALAINRFVSRHSPAKVWICWIVILFGLPAIWPGAPMTPIVLTYIALAVYSWIAPFAVRRWLRWRGQL